MATMTNHILDIHFVFKTCGINNNRYYRCYHYDNKVNNIWEYIL